MSLNSDEQTDAKRPMTFRFVNAADRDSTLVREVLVVARFDVSNRLTVQTAHSDSGGVEGIVRFWNESQLFANCAPFDDALPFHPVCVGVLDASKSEVKLSHRFSVRTLHRLDSL